MAENNEVLSESELRYKELSNKVKTTSEERDIALKEKDALIKERDFLSSFSEVAGTYPSAQEHRDEIKEKVLKGYSVEDATVSTLAKAGKLNQVERKEKIEAAGGSASTTISSGATKKPNEMSIPELRSALLKSEKEGDFNWQ